MNRTVLALFGVISALVIALGIIAILALGGGDDDDSSTASQTQDETGGGDSGEAAVGDLRLLGSDPRTLDPAAFIGDAASAYYMVEIFGGLVTLDRTMEVVPDIAESWDISDDGTVYTFHIRRDAAFHDGRPVTAADFKYSLDRTASSPISTVAESFLGDIVGARDVARGRATEISGVQVIDSSTLQITIDEAKPYFLAKLTYPTAFVVDERQVEANPNNWTFKPNGTGPYKLVEWRLNERIILEANERYHLGAPPTKRILFNLAGGNQLTLYEAGDIDVSGISIDDLERVQDPREPLNAEYKTGPELSISYIAFNTSAPPFDDVKVRQAFAHAIDRQQVIDVIYHGALPVANSYMQPGMPGYNENAQAPDFNPELARQLLSESKYGSADNLPPIILTEVGGGATVPVDSQAYVDMWRTNLGVDVQIELSETATFFDDIDQNRLQMWTIGWIMDYPDPEDIIDLHFYSTSRQNSTLYANPEVDRLIEEARTERDPELRLGIYQDAEEILLDEVPWIPLFFGVDHFLVKPYVKGFEPTPIQYPRLRYVTVER
jgi:oligopeptide transport system substrate-binding protein